MIDKILKISSLSAIFFIISGYLSAFTYYTFFGIDINNYIELKYLMTYLFTNPFLLILTLFLGVSFPTIRALSLLYKPTIVTNNSFYHFIKRNLKHAYIVISLFPIIFSLVIFIYNTYHHASFKTSVYLIAFSMLYLVYFNYRLVLRKDFYLTLYNSDITRKKNDELNKLSYISFMFYYYIIIITLSIVHAHEIIRLSIKPHYKYSFQYKGKYIETTDNLKFIGQLPNHLFLYDSKKRITYVYKSAEVDSLIIINSYK